MVDPIAKAQPARASLKYGQTRSKRCHNERLTSASALGSVVVLFMSHGHAEIRPADTVLVVKKRSEGMQNKAQDVESGCIMSDSLAPLPCKAGRYTV